jgi:hypothetical protein
MKPTLLAALAATAVALPQQQTSAMLRPRQAAGDSIQGGAIYSVPAGSSETITSISGVFRVPTPSAVTVGPTAGKKGILAFAIWIGIGGYAGYGSASQCSAAQGPVRAGLDIYYNGYSDSPMAPFAWYQSGASQDLGAFAYAGFALQVGDLVRITVTADGNNLDAVMENFKPGGANSTAGRTAAQRERPTYGLAESAGSALCRTEAAWVIEDHLTETEPSEPITLANFTDVVISEMTLTTSGGGGAGAVRAAKVININLPAQGGQLTDCAVQGTSELACKRVTGK